MERVVVGMQSTGGRLHGNGLLLLGPVIGSALIGVAFVVWIDRRRTGPGADRDTAVTVGLAVAGIVVLVGWFLTGQS